MLLIGAPPVLLILSVIGGAGWPTGCAEKESCVGVTPIAGGCSPVPESAMVCVRMASETLRFPFMLPITVGRKHDAYDAACMARQLSSAGTRFLKTSADCEPIEVRGRSPLLVRVTFCAADCCPVAVAGKLSDVGESASVAAVAPVPLRATVWVPAASTSESVPVAAPACVGSKVRESAQSLFGASEGPQPLAARTNGGVTVTPVTATASAACVFDGDRQRR